MSVPEEALVRRDSPPPSPSDVPPVSPPDNPVHALLVQVARLEGELGGAGEALGEARARADAAEARSAELSADLAAERARTEKAFAAFSALADRLDVLIGRAPSPVVASAGGLRRRYVGKTSRCIRRRRCHRI